MEAGKLFGSGLCMLLSMTRKNNDKTSFPVSIHSARTFLYLPLHSRMESAQENPVTDLTGQKCYSSKKLDRSPTNAIENFNSAIYDFFS